ncbi:hypothetical protein AB0G02_33175 [Actinosynnema sp. NPDC023658]|uniref:hypothetical protein n=1 Tax=Actinosynnema sp. NPDC023658 TaxID=3155465 RepID=UPI0033ED2ECE
MTALVRYLLVDVLRTDPADRPTMAEVADRLRTTSAPHAATTRSPATGPAAPRSEAPGPETPRAPTVPPATAHPMSHPAATRLDLNPTGPPSAPDTGPQRIDPQPTGPRPSTAPTSPDGHPTLLAPQRKRSGRTGLVVVGAAVLVGLVVLGLVLTSGNRDHGAADRTGTSSGRTTAPAPARLEQAVAEYYALLPRNTAQAWERLGPGLRAQGREPYEKAWRAVGDLTVSQPPAASGPDTVTIGVDFTDVQGRKFRESHRLRLVVGNGTPLIDSVEVLSSQQLDTGGQDNGDHGNKGNGDKGNDKKDDRRRGGGKNGEG